MGRYSSIASSFLDDEKERDRFGSVQESAGAMDYTSAARAMRRDLQAPAQPMSFDSQPLDLAISEPTGPRPPDYVAGPSGMDGFTPKPYSADRSFKGSPGAGGTPLEQTRAFASDWLRNPSRSIPFRTHTSIVVTELA